MTIHKMPNFPLMIGQKKDKNRVVRV